MEFTINDYRMKNKIREVCRVCGSDVIHSREYNQPTMECILFLRERIQKLENKGAQNEI